MYPLPSKPYSVIRLTGILLCILHSYRSHAQSMEFLEASFANFKDKFPIESVYLHLDKGECLAGDTIWWKGYLFSGTERSSISTNLYVELFTEDGHLISQRLCPVIESQSAGQVAIPDTLVSGRYFIRAYTRYQTNFDTVQLFTAPVTVYNAHDQREVCIPERVDRDPEPKMTVNNGLTWVSSVHAQELYCLLDADSLSPYLGKPLHVVAMSYHHPHCHATLTLSEKKLWKDFTMSCKGLSGYVDLLLWVDSNLIARQTLFVPQETVASVTLVPDTLNYAPEGYNSWRVKIDDSLLYTCSVSVTDADQTQEAPQDILHAINPDPLDYRDLLSGRLPVIKVQDSTYLSWNGTIVKSSGKPVSRGELIALITKEQTDFSDTRMLTLEKGGHFVLKNVFFFDTARLHFQLNHMDGSSSQSMRMSLTNATVSPFFTAPVSNVWRDSLVKTWLPVSIVHSTPTVYHAAKTLDTVVVKHHPDFRGELDRIYTTGVFAEPTLFSFDVRNERNYHELESYLRANIPGFYCNPPADTPYYKNQRTVIFYLNEQLLAWEDLKNYRVSDLGYIKAFLEQHWFGDSPFMRWKTGYKGAILQPAGDDGKGKLLKIPVDEDPLIVCLYTRKGDDLPNTNGVLYNLSLKGYAAIIPFKGANGHGPTLFWNPIARNNEFRIQFRNNATAKRFRVNMEGVNRQGKVLKYEKIMTVIEN